jgi:hypothetical protein
MIKEAVHVFYTKSPHVGTSFFAFPNIRLFLMSAYLSLKCLRDKNYRVKLVTDKLGKQYLIDTFGLEYDEVTLELEDVSFNPHLWGMAKMHTFSIQKNPFLYIDLDAFLFNDIGDDLKRADIFFQNFEPNYYTAYDTYSRFYNYFRFEKNKIIEEYEKRVGEKFYGDAYNTAIFGGNNIDLIQKASKEVLRYCEKNLSNVDNKYIGDRVSVFMEQVYLHYYLKLQKNVDVQFHIKDTITEKLDYFNKWRDDYVHMISFEKYNLNMMRGLYKMVEKTPFEEKEMDTWGLNYVDLLTLTRDI